MSIQMKKDNSWFVEPECINLGCGNKVHTRKINKNGTRDIRAECNKCHLGGRNRPGVTPHKKDYCENRDGRLGHKCTATIMGYHQLDLDHIDGDRDNQIFENFQTLDKCCHAEKTKREGDNKRQDRYFTT